MYENTCVQGIGNNHLGREKVCLTGYFQFNISCSFLFLAYTADHTAQRSVYVFFHRIALQLVFHQYFNKFTDAVFSCLVSHNQLLKSPLSVM